MQLSIRRLIAIGTALLILLTVSSCKATDKQASKESQTETTRQSDVSETSESLFGIVKADDFTITENEEGVPLITGTLSSGVTVNARIYCERDLESPGTGSVDTAMTRTFSSEDIDIADENGEGINIQTTKYALYFSAGSKSHKTPDRIPWFSTEYAWQTSDFAFMTSDEAYDLFDQAALDLGITLSSVCKVDRVPYGVFDTYYRVLMLSQMESVPDTEWTQADDAYFLQSAQEWNQLPVVSESLAHSFDGTNLEGDQFRILLSTQVTAIVTSEGIRNMTFYCIYQLEEQGGQQLLISMWDALQTLKYHIDNPTYPLESLYDISGLQNRDLTIDQIELCYVPMWQGTPGIASDSLFDMVPCWTFRIIGYDESGFILTHTCIVNAITNEYILQTNYMPD